ncbi:MAG: FHA domain-containing protein [bacterium]
MAKVIVKYRDAALREVLITKSIMTIGRVEQNDIPIKNLAVSRQHARISQEKGDYVLEDLDSLNGTFVNDKKVSKYVLKDGDEILIGKHTLVFSEEAGISEVMDQDVDIPLTEKTAILDTRKQRELIGEPAGEYRNTLEMPEDYKAGIMFIEGGDGQQNIELTRRITIAGKGKDTDLRLTGLFVGKRAFIISRRLDGYFITHSGGGCMTRVNGQEVKEERALSDGDVVSVGKTKMRFYIKNGNPS